MSRPTADPSLPPSLSCLPAGARQPVPFGSRVRAAGAGLAGGAVAAGLGLGAPAVAVLLLWVSSPYPDSGPDGALRTAAALWLLGHGAELVRSVGGGGGTAPVGVSPLLLGLLPVWLLYRAARSAAESPDYAPRDPTRDAGRSPARGAGRPRLSGMLGWLCAGYLLVGVCAAFYAAGGPLRVEPRGALPQLCVVAVAAVLCGMWAATGPAEMPGAVRAAVARRRRSGTALRAAAAGTAVLLGGGALLVCGSLILHGIETQQAFFALTEPWSGRFAVLLLSLALAPNAAVWGAAYGLGPGFTVGAGSTVGPLAAVGYPALPYFPLLAALPEEGPGSPLTWSAGAVPAVAGIVVGWFTARAAPRARAAGRPVPGRWETLQTSLYAALGCAAMTGLLAGLSGGPLGTGALARFGPDPWLTGGAAFVWTATVALPCSLVLRGWWLRGHRGSRTV